MERPLPAGGYARLSGHEHDAVHRPEEAAVADVADDPRQRVAHGADEVQDRVRLRRRRRAALGDERGAARHARRRVRRDRDARDGSAARRPPADERAKAHVADAQEQGRGQAVSPARLDDARASVRARRHAADRAALLGRLQLLADGDHATTGAPPGRRARRWSAAATSSRRSRGRRTARSSPTCATTARRRSG